MQTRNYTGFVHAGLLSVALTDEQVLAHYLDTLRVDNLSIKVDIEVAFLPCDVDS